MDKKDEQIEQKLIALETSILNDAENKVASTKEPSKEVTAPPMLPAPVIDPRSDMYYFAGLGLVLTGLLLLFNHVHIGSGMFAALGLGSHGIGILMVPLLIGLGWAFYDSKSKIAYAIIAVACGLLFFSILSSLIMTFPTTSLLGLIFMLLPFAAGGALLLKSAGGPEGVKQKLRDQNLLK